MHWAPEKERRNMGNSGENQGVTGNVEIVFAIPTDDPKVWRMKNGSLTFSNGTTAGIDVEGGYIPHFKGEHGLTVTYCVFRDVKQQGTRVVGDITMTTCVDGRVVEADDIADGVDIIPTQKMAAVFSGKRKRLRTSPDR